MNDLIRRLQKLDADAALTPAGDGVTWHHDDTMVVTLITSENELAQAIRHTGRDVRDDLWPGITIEDAGFNLLMVHLDEVVATRDVTEPLRLTRDGLIWPESRPPAFDVQLDPGDGPYHWSAERPGGEDDLRG